MLRSWTLLQYCNGGCEGVATQVLCKARVEENGAGEEEADRVGNMTWV